MNYPVWRFAIALSVIAGSQTLHFTMVNAPSRQPSPRPQESRLQDSQQQNSRQQASRQQWMALLAKAPLAALEQQVAGLGGLPTYGFLRSPEIGLAMVRGRAGGRGQLFNLGEMTITRCVVQLDASTSPLLPEDAPPPISGFGYVAGRSRRHAELAAVCDALMQHQDWADRVQTQVIEPLEAIAQAARTTEAAEVESTRVNFFTLLRGES